MRLHVIHYSLGRQVSRVILSKQLLIQGFTVFRWSDQWPMAFKEIAQWIQEVGNFNSTTHLVFVAVNYQVVPGSHER